MAKRFTAQLFVSSMIHLFSSPLLNYSFFSGFSLQGLSAYTTVQSLRQLFSPFGQITEARLIRDHQTQRPKGFGFISFVSEDDAQKALKALNRKIINGRLVFVEAAKEVEATITNLKINKA